MTTTVGRMAIVLHSHSPWLLGHGSWPVGEEWLRQAWAHSYLPVVAMLRERAERGRTGMLTLGITPVLAAQWDAPQSITEQRRWLADWRLRATGKALQAQQQGDGPAYVDAIRHHQLATTAERELDVHWSAGGSAAIRPLADAGAIEILGGPMTHTFTPHLLDPIADLALASGLDDGAIRLGRRPRGIWTPECAFSPGMENWYRRHGVTHTVIDGPTLQRVGATLHRPHGLSGSDTVVFGRDLSLTYRVWSPRRGYPGAPWYQDFHSFDHVWGLRPHRVTRRSSPVKRPYDRARALHQASVDADDFLVHARRTLMDSSQSDPLVVVAYDTELFGHWWHEGPIFLAHVLDRARHAGIELTTLAGELERAHCASSRAVDLQAGSWGSGKDFGVWEDGEAGDLRKAGNGAQYAVLDWFNNIDPRGRDRLGDRIATELLLALASDWPFMITKDSAADYARDRAQGHFHRLSELLRGHLPAAELDPRLPFADARYLNFP